jgi:hypothetical protein
MAGIDIGRAAGAAAAAEPNEGGVEAGSCTAAIGWLE